MKTTDQQLDTIFDVVHSCIHHKEYHELSKWFYGFIPQVKEMPLDIILAYVTASIPAAKYIKYRRRFINEAKKIHPDINGLWNGL